MYDPFTSRYAFACPSRGETHVLLSAFRSIEQLPGAAHPAVFRVRFGCDCGEEHDGLLTHEELDWAPLGLRAGTFLNLMTARLESAGAELGDRAAGQIGRGGWPWSFFCYPEERPRPVFPSSFVLLAATEGPVGVVEHVFADDAVRTLDEFRAELWSASFDARRLALE
jgi:hypothetical protein